MPGRPGTADRSVMLGTIRARARRRPGSGGWFNPRSGAQSSELALDAAAAPARVLSVTAKALAGYLDAGGGRFDTFYLVTNGAVAPDLDGALAIGDDVADIAALLQQDATGGH